MIFVKHTLIFFRQLRRTYKTNLKVLPMDRPTAYFRLLDGSEQFQVCFLFKNEILNIERECNFNRQLSEKVGSFLNRVKANLDKFVSKKVKRKQKSPNSPPSVVEVTTELLHNGHHVNSETVCKDIFFGSEEPSNLILRMVGTEYLISVNCPWVNAFSLPSSIMAGFPIYPSKFDTLFADKKNCSFHWFKIKCDNKQLVVPEAPGWQRLESGFVYSTNNEDIGHYLKLTCIPSDGERNGPSSSAISTNPVEAGPGSCPFETRHAFTTRRLSGNKFRVVSYNILSDVYAETEAALNDLFPYCPPYALKIDYRKQLFLKELLGYNADLIFLQEVDEKMFLQDLHYVLEPLGYEGKFACKGGTVREGVACFFAKDRFRLQSSHTIILGEEVQRNQCLSHVWKLISEKEPLKLRVIGRHTALQVVVLQSLDKPDQLLVAANTHLYFHPDADHVRLLQGGMSMLLLTEFIKTTAKENPGRKISLIFSGDFNSTPDCGFYKLMTTNHVPEDCIDWNSNKEEAVEGFSLSQPWKMASACGTPQFTNFTAGFADCLDYIYYQVDNLDVEQVIPLPCDEDLRRHTALPSVVFPSDHIALVADLKWTS